MLALTIREKNGEERQLIFDKEEVTIGRATGSDIVLPRSNISKRHARLVDKHDKVVIVDLRSTNGTYVNGRRITAPELLTYDDKVYIGDFVIRLSRPAEQHPSQRMTAPYSASPTPMGDIAPPAPRGARAATQAVDPPAADLYEEEPLPPGPPPSDTHDLDDDASTRAIDASLAAQIDDADEPHTKRAAPPPHVAPKAAAPVAKAAPVAHAQPAHAQPAPAHAQPAPAHAQPAPAHAQPAPAAKKEPAPAPAPAPAAKKEPAQPLKKEAPPAPLPKKEVAAEAPPKPQPRPAPKSSMDDGATLMSLEKMKKPAPPPMPEPDLEPEQTGEDASLATDVWGQWNGMLTTLVQRIEADHPDGVDGNEAQDIAESALAQAIDAGEIAAETDRGALVADALAELVGLGALAELEADPSVRVVVVNGTKSVFVDRGAGVLEANGRVFATPTSYRRALRQLIAGTGHRIAVPPNVSPGLDQLRLADGSVVRILEPGAGADPLLVWRRPAVDAPTLADLVADRFLDAAQEKELHAAASAGRNLVLCGPHGNVLAAALAGAWPWERRIVAIGDGSRVALTHPNVARVGASGIGTIADLLALEPDAVVFEALEGRAAHLWAEASLGSGRPVLAVSNEGNGERALKRLALVLELHYGVSGRGAALVGEAVDLVVTLKTEADGTTRVERIDEVEAQKDGYSLKAKARR